MSCQRVSVQYALSSEVDAPLKFVVRRIHTDPSIPFTLESDLVSKNSPAGDFSPLCDGVSAPLRNMNPFTCVRFRLCSERGVLIAQALVPVFNQRGVVVEGKQLIFFEGSLESRKYLSREYVLAETVGAGVWNLPIPSAEQVLARIPSHVPYLVVEFFSPLSGIPIIFSDKFKAVLGLSGGSPVVSFRKDMHFESSPPRKLSSDSAGSTSSRPSQVRVNWMVINGPVYGGRAGLVPSTELSTCIASGCPVQLIDYELFREHPAAVKAARIHRTNQAAVMSKAAKPTAEQVARLCDIISQPIRALSQEERELIVRFAWSLTDKKQALLKVLIGLGEVWDEQGFQTALVDEILAAWTPVGIDGALALLGREIGRSPFFAAPVRRYAISRLAAVASPSELQLYMFQLVQSLRYEDEIAQLSTFLIEKSCKDEALATAFFWCLESEGITSSVSQLLWRELARTEVGKIIKARIEMQCQFRLRLLDISAVLQRTVPSGMTRNDVLRDALRSASPNAAPATSVRGVNLTTRLNFPQVGSEPVEIPIPVQPRLSLVRVDDKNSFCIKSAKAPFVIACECFNKDTKEIEFKKYMFKTGDDLRQDQLVIQFITLIDGLLKSYGLDLKLSPYKVLATSADDGFVEFVSDSQTLSSVLNDNNNDLLQYFRSVKPRNDVLFGIDPTVLDTFARSCAGYCAITYILGIGDRHMDNLLVTTEGKMFHVDFGYILGRDPKPFPPPMKLCREMVEGMGGTGSVYYKSFVSKCTQAFLIMRRHSNLLISLLYLAADSSIKDMREQDPEMAIMKVQKRLMPEVSDEVAEQHMINLINESTSALFPVVFEKFHKWAAYWRQ